MKVQRPTQIPLRVLSLGGGTQSCALALMSALGELPRLDRVIFADTQGERRRTYEYLHGFLTEQLATAGIPLDIVTAGSLERALLGARMPANPTPPAFTSTPEGEWGKIRGYKCSYDFKRRVVVRQVKRLCGGRGAWKGAEVEQWIGYSFDEGHRMKALDECRCGHNRTVRHGQRVSLIHREGTGCERCDCAAFEPWMTNRYPLIERRMKRADTVRWFVEHGFPVPPRSACKFCPNASDARWAEIRTQDPDEFEDACRVDEAIRDVGGFPDRGKQEFGAGTRLWLHRSRRPLREAVANEPDPRLFDGFDECDTGVCGT